MKLRDYQQECVLKTISHLKNNDRALIQLPTGAGKTVVFWSLIEKYDNALIIVPSIQLAEQCYEQGLNFIHSSSISRKFGSHKNKHKKYHITTIQSLNSLSSLQEIKEREFSILIIDEAHRSGSDSYQKVIDYLGIPKVVGLTATPSRNDAIKLSDIFGNLIFSRSIIELIDLGHLCDMEAIRIKTNVSLSGIALGESDFQITSLFRKINIDHRNQLIFQCYEDHCKGLKTLLFTVNVEHCLILEKIFLDKGVKAKAIYGELTLKIRHAILDDFRNGKIDVLINNQLLTEGFDEPSIQCILMARPTSSVVLYHQIIGRGLRPHPSKKLCKLVELADNYHRICNFWCLDKKEIAANQLNKNYTDKIKLSELQNYKTDFLIDTVEEEKFDIFNRIELNYDYIKKELPEVEKFDLTFEEALFVVWRTKKLEEYKKWLQ